MANSRQRSKRERTTIAQRRLIRAMGARANGVRRQEQTFSDRCTEVRELAGERWPDFSEQAPTLAGWRGGATPAQAFYIVGLILPPKTAAA
jgi:hypothetical protein